MTEHLNLSGSRFGFSRILELLMLVHGSGQGRWSPLLALFVFPFSASYSTTSSSASLPAFFFCQGSTGNFYLRTSTYSRFKKKNKRAQGMHNVCTECKHENGPCLHEEALACVTSSDGVAALADRAVRSNHLPYLCWSGGLRGAYAPVLRALARQRPGSVQAVLTHLRAEFAARASSAGGPLINTGPLCESLWSLFCALSQEERSAEALQPLWSFLQTTPGLRQRPDDTARIVRSLLCARRTAAALRVAAVVLARPPLPPDVGFVSWLGVAGVLWHSRTDPPLEALLSRVLDLLGLRGCAREGPNFQCAVAVVSALDACLLQLERTTVLAALADASELLRLSDENWAAAAAFARAPVLLDFFLLSEPRPVHQRRAQTLLELALCGAYSVEGGDVLFRLEAVKSVLCMAGLLATVGAPTVWLQRWDHAFREPWKLWRTIRQKAYASKGFYSPTPLLKFLQQLSVDVSQSHLRLAADSEGCSAEIASSRKQHISAPPLLEHRKEVNWDYKDGVGRECRGAADTNYDHAGVCRMPPATVTTSSGRFDCLLRAVQPKEWGDAEDPGGITAAVSALDELRAKLATQLTLLQGECDSCVVCLGEPGRDECTELVRLVPCDHAQICAGCAAQLVNCPLCRTAIDAVI
eukprot:g73207.t1